MRISKNIFQLVEEQVEFLLGLNSKSVFTISDVKSEQKTGDSILSRVIKFWKKEELVERKTKPGTHGGYQYQYSFTPKARKKLTKLLILLLDNLKIKDRLIKSLKKLDNDNKEAVFAHITKFFKELEEA